MTKKALAATIGVSPQSVSRYERGKMDPAPEALAALSEALDFPESFFFADPVDAVETDAVSFRALSRMGARDRDSALASATIALEVSDWLDEHFNLPEPSLPDFHLEGGGGVVEAEAVADQIRALWLLGSKPIYNMVHLLELKGVRVFSVPAGLDIDAFSFWRDGRPFVFLTMGKSPERSRFDAAHELGHLLLHRHSERSKAIETEANAFASALLAPRHSVLARTHNYMTLDEVCQEKRYWKISVAALVYRLHKVGRLSDWPYRQMMTELSVKGWRRSEPDSCPRERSQVIRKVLAILRESDRSAATIAEAVGVHPADLHELLFRLTLHAVDGGGETTAPPPRRVDLDEDGSSRSAPHLRLVKGGRS